MFSSAGRAVVTPKLIGLMLLAIPLGIFFGACRDSRKARYCPADSLRVRHDRSPVGFPAVMHAIVHTGGIVPSILFGVPTMV